MNKHAYILGQYTALQKQAGLGDIVSTPARAVSGAIKGVFSAPGRLAGGIYNNFTPAGIIGQHMPSNSVIGKALRAPGAAANAVGNGIGTIASAPMAAAAGVTRFAGNAINHPINTAKNIGNAISNISSGKPPQPSYGTPRAYNPYASR